MELTSMRSEIPVKYIRENFEPGDRLAIILVQKQTGAVVQRLAPAEKIASEDFQAWLRHKNAERYEIYVSMKALDEHARGRTKSDVATIRHVYLDFDTAAVEKLLARQDLPQPNYLVNSSPDGGRSSGKSKDSQKNRRSNCNEHSGVKPAPTLRQRTAPAS